MTHYTRKITSLILIFAFVIAMWTFPPSEVSRAGAIQITFGDGTWNPCDQAIRISIFNLDTGETEVTCDFANARAAASLTYELGLGITFIRAEGCKLDYLLQFEDNGRRIDGMTWIENSPVYAVPNNMNIIAIDNPAWQNMFLSIYLSKIDQYGNYVYNCENQFANTFLLYDCAGAETIFNYLGYSFLGTPGMIPIDSSHVVVIEPVYWFLNNMIQDRSQIKYFYGSATEWALYSQSVKNYIHVNAVGDNSGNPIRCNGIHGVMGLLTRLAAPMSTYTRKGRNLIIDGKLLRIDEMNDRIIQDFKGITGCGNIATIDKIDNEIMRHFGADYLLPNELYDLSVEIVNTDFRSNTDSMLSFKLETNGSVQFAPAYDDITEDGDYYGVMLELETLPGSDVRLGTVQLTCDGIPKEPGASSVSTYIFDDWHTPNQEGVWKFALHARSPEGRITYKSNSGTPIDPRNENTDYYFSVNITALSSMLNEPPDTTADDVAPQHFTPPSGDLSYLSPVTTASWNTYEVYQGGTEEEPAVGFIRHDYYKTIVMNGTKPISYDNVTSSYINDAGELVTKSGYGIGLSGSCVISGNYGSAGGGYQNGVVMFPEYDYSTYGSLIEKNWRGGFFLEKNRYSKYYSDSLLNAYSRVHFTPIWYPDGEYNIQVFMFDSWTPAGMLWDCRTYTVRIEGSMYDDWYVTRA